MATAGAAAPASEINGIIAGTLSRPIVRLVQTVAQSIPHNTLTALTFTAEEIDTDGFHDTSTNPSRITPTKAGYYRLTGTALMSGRNDWTYIQGGFGKNGVATAPHNRIGPNTSATARGVTISIIQAANGSTDYFELEVLHVNGASAATNTNVSGPQFSSTFECEFIRDL